jgi:ABC-type dipeptide/oligopeptide/nickel transport system permease component
MTAILLFVAIGVVIANLIADLLHAALDPRVRQR